MDYIEFLYLNPQLAYENNLQTAEDASNYWHYNSNQIVPTNLSYLPESFNSFKFAVDRKDDLNFSDLNFYIKETMSFNFSSNEIESKAIYFPSIYKQVVSSNNGLFSPAYDLTSNDYVKIIDNQGNSHTSRVLSVSNNIFDTTINLPVGETALLYGIKLYDFDRLAKINYFYTSNTTFTPSNFNYELYKLLYPDSIQLTEEEAYLEFVINNRIGSVDDIGGATENRIIISNDNSNITITSNIYNTSYYTPSNTFDDLFINNSLSFGNTLLSYITNDPTRHISLSSSNNPGLITEYAVKTYMKNILYPLASFSNVVGDSASFNNINVDVLKTLNRDSVLIDHNVEISSNLLLRGDLINYNNIYNAGGIGIGFSSSNIISSLFTNIDSNLLTDNLHVSESAYVAGTTQIDGKILGSLDVNIKGGLYGSKIGIGQVSFETLNVNNDYSPGSISQVNDILTSDNSLYVESNIFVNNSSGNNSTIQTLYLPYREDTQQNLVYVSSKTGSDLNMNHYVRTVNDLLKINKAFNVINTSNVLMDTMLYNIRVGDILVSKYQSYIVTSITSNGVIIDTSISEDFILLQEIRLLNRTYFDIGNMLYEITNQMRGLADYIKCV
jgi:3',5'-cyclic AMP phosphodiesterase CpdA